MSVEQIRLHYDRDYGIDRRGGWSLSINGSFVVQFERFLLVALAKSLWKHLTYQMGF